MNEKKEPALVFVSELTGAVLDYWVARAEGHEWRCAWMLEQQGLRKWQNYEEAWGNPTRPYSTEWEFGGPLIDKHNLALGNNHGVIEFSDWGDGKPSPMWRCYHPEWVNPWTGKKGESRACPAGEGDTPLQAICRAVVHSCFGEKVPEVQP